MLLKIFDLLRQADVKGTVLTY